MNCPNCNTQLPAGTAFCPECGARIGASSQVLRVLQGRYELTQKLGQGGMGSVYLAADRRLSTVRWAVKEMSDSAITSPLERQQAGESFRHEAELLARLAHPNLPRVTDHFQEDGKNYLVMEFVPGETLQDYCQRNGAPRPLNEVLGWADQLCEVLSYLHSQRPPVIFRDLKPANVILTPEGRLKLIDFGIARLFKPGQSHDTQAYGTMGYSAPEQYGRGQTDARSDIYSLAVLLHQLLTGFDPGAAPFRLPPANQVNPAVPPAVAATLARAMATEPEQRFASVEELRQALHGSGNLVQQRNVQPRQNLAPAIGVPPAIDSRSTPGGAQSTDLARVAFWMGVGSIGIMLLAIAMVGIGVATQGADNTLSSFGVVLSLLPLFTGPSGAIVGVVALTRPQIRTTSHGRRDAAVGVAAGLGTLVLCCVLFALIPSSSSDSESRSAAPATSACARIVIEPLASSKTNL